MGDAEWGWPSSSSVSLIIFASFAFKKNAPSLACVADAATNFRMLQRTWMASLRKMGWLSWGMDHRKKYPAALLQAFRALRYETL